MPYYIGLMSGTSADGIDAVIVSINDDQIDLIQSISVDYDKSLFEDIVTAFTQSKLSLVEIGELDIRLGLAFADAVLKLTQSIDASQIVAIGSHGQTVHHSPNSNYPFTMQLGNGATIALQTGLRTVTDFRSNDIAAGGQGAPLAPLFHQQYFKSSKQSRVIINIGGIANLTYLSKALDCKHEQEVTLPFIGFDTGPGNALIDSWASLHINMPYDDKGEWARGGDIDTHLLQQLLNDPYFKKAAPKSTGKEYFNLDWLRGFIDVENCHPQNVSTTLTHLTAASIAQAIINYTDTEAGIYLCGGGVRNLYLVELISHYSKNRKVSTTQALGIDPDFVEAIAFAWLAKARIEEKALDTRLITGARQPVILGTVHLP